MSVFGKSPIESRKNQVWSFTFLINKKPNLYSIFNTYYEKYDELNATVGSISDPLFTLIYGASFYGCIKDASA